MALDANGNLIPEVGGNPLGGSQAVGLGLSSFGALGGFIEGMFAGKAAKLRARGNLLQAENLGRAATLSDKNAQYTRISTGIQQYQSDRDATLTIGGQEADAAGAGLAEEGSVTDVLRASTQQAALHHAVLGFQGAVAEEGYQEQAKSYRNMQSAALYAAKFEQKNAKWAPWLGALKGVAAAASVVK